MTRTTGFHLTLTGLLLTGFGCADTSERNSLAWRDSKLLAGVQWDHPLYETTFDDPGAVNDWVLEGGESMEVRDGNLVLSNGTESQVSEWKGKHLVCWLKQEVPASFLLEFTVCPDDRQRGLAIVFFNARGIHGESIFDPTLAKRDGQFNLYHSGDLNNYHTSYWAGGRGTANLRKNKGFHLVASGRDFIELGSPGEFQVVQVYNRNGLIHLLVDGQLVLDWRDDGQYGPKNNHPGWLALRQMAHTHSARYGRVAVYPVKE